MLKNKGLSGHGASDKLKELSKQRAKEKAEIRGREHKADKSPDNLFYEFIHRAFMRRLQMSSYRDQFALKGAQMMRKVTNEDWRATQDIDFNVSQAMDDKQLAAALKDILTQQPKVPDGVEFLLQDGVSLKKDRTHATIAGQKLSLKAKVGKSAYVLDIDLGFENKIHAPLRTIEFPPMIKGEEPVTVLAVPPENAIAEKFRAMVVWGLSTSRVKDFFDVQRFASVLEIDADVIAEEVRGTLEQLNVELPPMSEIDVLDPEVLNTYDGDSLKRQWHAFGEKYGGDIPDFVECVKEIREFIGPVVDYVRDEGPSPGVWSPDTGWSKNMENTFS
ncbi:nucleotidyl transferase AbiEii/AbiGii toxin family protein [Sulfitobacter sp. R18_1]|uniref:nucleotidyl transferase AbiEii/AbiGii toxin family protein n=1 Tax=Sulfitobacter sp. R18_1 TaxID=2821104 RepID=UPI001ADBA647|nr:nucleotidyl transferase AbiEii/AbiGii toxin family protein [Sulfitobacter sp. R18_1]MBO9428362.1 nucleotidyl transferase AbiEii/AbiGii toxin family protein [Sulfitobacter sp. R18_1]